MADRANSNQINVAKRLQSWDTLRARKLEVKQYRESDFEHVSTYTVLISSYIAMISCYMSVIMFIKVYLAVFNPH